MPPIAGPSGSPAASDGELALSDSLLPDGFVSVVTWSGRPWPVQGEAGGGGWVYEPPVCLCHTPVSSPPVPRLGEEEAPRGKEL